MFDLGAVPAPVLLRGDQQLLVQLRDVAKPNLGAFRRRSLRDGVSEPVHVAAGAVVDDRDATRAFGEWAGHRLNGDDPRRDGDRYV